MAGRIKQGRPLESTQREDVLQLCQPLCLCRQPIRRQGTITRALDDLADILIAVVEPFGDAPAFEIGDGFETGHFRVPGQFDVAGDGHGGQGQDEPVEQQEGDPLTPGEGGRHRWLADATTQHGIKHEGRDEDEEPALDGACHGELGRGAEQPLHRLVGEQDPQACHGGIGEHDVEHMCPGQRSLSHPRPRCHPGSVRQW